MPDEKKLLKKRALFSVIFTLLMAGLSVAASLLSSCLGGFSLGYFPLILTGALCGSMPGIIAVMLAMIYSFIMEPLSSYVLALCLIAVLLSASASGRKVYKSLIRSILLGAFIALITGAVNGIILNIATTGEVGRDIAARTLRAFAYALPESEGAMITAFAVFRFLPDRIKVIIPNGVFYLTETGGQYRNLEDRIKKLSSGLSFRVTRVIALEAMILTILAAFVAIHLTSIVNSESLRPQNDAEALMMSEGDMKPPEGDMAPPDGDVPPPGSGGSDRPSLPSENRAQGKRAIGILGEAVGAGDIEDGIFDDRQRFNPFSREHDLDSKMTLAFSFRLIMVLFSAAIITSALADAYLQLTVAKPIRKMSKAMKGFAYSEKDGSIGGTEELADIKIKSRDEIQELHDALVKTVADTEDYLERLREEDRMRNELDVAKASSDAKSAFLSSMSHEIRTPINAVLGFDEMILLENKDPEIARYAEDIQSAGKTLLALINDILDFSKIEAGKMEIVPVRYELTSTINDVVSMTMSLANDKGLSFDVKVDPATPHLLLGDEIRIKQCMTNLLSNAVKYTEQGGLTLGVGFEKTEEDDSILLTISVKDTGIGIREEDMEKLFSAFDRLDQVRNKAVKGTGLGLSITKQLLESMGSTLEVESEYEKGSDFHFSLRQQVVKWEEIGDLSEAFKKYVPRGGSEQQDDTFYAPDADILVTDDTENNLLVVTRLLKRTGVRIDTADSGAGTLEMVKRKKYDIIYLDHMMPGMDGIETLHAMKDLDGNMNQDTPVVVLTANAVAGSREMYMKEGFTDYMTKPVSYRSLRDSLKKYLSDEKIQERPAEENAETVTEASKRDPLSFLASALEGVTDIDIEEGIKNSGDVETLADVIRDYHAGIEENSDRIERELSEGKIKDYTVHVHALKSSSRLIGAMHLSRMALELENKGNAYLKAVYDGDKGNAEETLVSLKEKTPELLELYRSLREKLSKAAGAGEDEAGRDLKEISEEDLMEMLKAVREFAEAFDMDTVDNIMGQLEGYRVPEDRMDMTSSLQKAVRNVDRDAILSILADI